AGLAGRVERERAAVAARRGRLDLLDDEPPLGDRDAAARPAAAPVHGRHCDGAADVEIERQRAADLAELGREQREKAEIGPLESDAARDRRIALAQVV